MDDEPGVFGLSLRGPSDEWETTEWGTRLDEFLFDGERRLETVDLGPDRVLVTSHRLLVFTPTTDGENFRAIDRPNVAGVDIRHRTGENALPMAGKLGLVGTVVLLTAFAFDPGWLRGSSGSDSAPANAGTVDQSAGLLSTLDGALLSVGVVLLAAALLLAGYYALARSPVIVVWIDGDEDVVLPIRREPEAKLDALRDALRPS